MERKEDAGGRRTNIPGNLLALAPPPGTVAALIGAAISLPEYLLGRQQVYVPSFFPNETLGDALAIFGATAFVAKLVHVVRVFHDPVGVAVGQYRQSVTTGEHHSQEKQA